MKAAFADTSYYQALLNPKDNWHESARQVSIAYRGTVMTSEYVLCELGALMSYGHLRGLFIELVNGLKSAPYVEIIPGSHYTFEKGLALFENRPDKDWSLTDCISFALMREMGLTDALTCDRHFEQAGFRAMLFQ